MLIKININEIALGELKARNGNTNKKAPNFG
jgi:hypothetical protein